MEEVTNTVVTKIVDCLLDQIKLHGSYLLCLEKFDEDLRHEKSELELKVVSVKERATLASKENKEVTEAVKKWQNEVEEILKEVQKLEERIEKAGNKCFPMSCSYSLAKQVECKTQQIVKLKNGCEFEPFSLPIELEGMHYFSSEGFVYFKSTKSACDEILQSIKDDERHMIGLYGIGGSGKTSLAKEVGKKIEELKLYDKVIEAVVSQPINIKDIQDQISDQLGLGKNLDEQSIQGRARRLSQKLKVGKTLIILDDVWEVINLEDIGIPSNDYKGCCVLLTTRLRRVCALMNCQSIIELSPLDPEEAWDLFKLHANINDDCSNELKDVARNIADECKGLPIAIVTVGRTLKGKDFVEWELALSRLKESQPMENIEEGLRNPYACLEFSYDHLKSSTAKSLFLLCSMFPEDYDIHKENLVRFGNGILELGESFDSMEKVRREVDVAINILVDSCLLIPNKKRESIVKMHDLVRDVALWIARKKSEAILVARKAVPRMLMENETVKDTKVISLWDLERNFKLSDEFHCLTLMSLLLHSRHLGFKPNIYLGGMKALKVLALVRFSLNWDSHFVFFHHLKLLSGGKDYLETWSVPQSIKSLTNLRTLCLRGNRLGDISFLITLRELEILDLRGSSFDELPNEIAAKKKLKLLDLYKCSIKKSPYEVIGKCSQLQELYILDDKSPCPENVSFPSLQRYAICVSLISGVTWYNKIAEISTKVSRALCMEGYNVSAISSSMNDLFLRAEMLHLRKCRIDNKDYLSSKVKHLLFESCPKMKFIVGDRIKAAKSNILEVEQVFFHLVTLTLNRMEDLEQVFQDSTINCSLQRLVKVYICRCQKLETIFSPTIVTSLPELRELHVKECHKLKCLFSYSLASHCPSLTELWIQDCSKLERVVDGFKGKDVEESGEQEDWPLFPKLTMLELRSLPQLKEIFPGFENRKLTLDIKDCPNLILLE